MQQRPALPLSAPLVPCSPHLSLQYTLIRSLFLNASPFSPWAPLAMVVGSGCTILPATWRRFERLVATMVLVLCFLAFGASGLLMHPVSGTDTAVTWYRMPRLSFYDPPAPPGYWDAYNVTGPFIVTSDKHTTENLTGAILVYLTNNGESQDEAISWFKDRGLVALVTLLHQATDYPGFGNWVRQGIQLPSYNFPLFELSQAQLDDIQAKFLFNSSTGALATITHDSNPWNPTFDYALPAVGFTILVPSGLIAIWALYKLVLIILQEGVRLTIAQFVLLVNVLGCGIRVVWCAADPFGAYGTTNFLFTQIMLSITFPFAIAGALLISLYWHELVKRTGKKINLFLDRMFWPFLAWCLVMLAFECATSTLRGLYFTLVVLTLLDGIIYIVVVVFVLAFFLVTRYRLQQVFDKLNDGLQRSKDERLKLATVRIQAMVVCMVVWVVFLALLGMTDLAWTPWGYPILWGLFYNNTQIMCGLQTLMIRAPQKRWGRWMFGSQWSESASSHRFASSELFPPSGTSTVPSAVV